MFARTNLPLILGCLLFLGAAPFTPVPLAAQEALEDTEADPPEADQEDPAPEQTDKPSRQLLDRAVKLLGGEAALRRVNAIRAEGTYTFGRTSLPFVMIRKAPAQYRLEMEQEMRYGRVAKIITATDGEAAWTWDQTPEDAEPMRLGKAETQAVIRSNRLFAPLLDADDRGIKFRYEGKGELRGRPVYMVKAYYPDGTREWLYFDGKTGILLMHSREMMFANSLMMVDHLFLNYKKFGDVYFPVNIERQVGGETVGDMVVDSLQLNPSVDGQAFAFPGPAKKEFWLRQGGN